jgi:hypothetical protein
MAMSFDALHGDERLVDRIISAFNYSDSKINYSGSLMWQHINKLSAEFIEDLRQKRFDEVAYNLRHPHTNNLFYGFDNITKAVCGDAPGAHGEAQAARQASQMLTLLVQLAEATGAIRAANPEQSEQLKLVMDRSVPTLLASLDAALGYNLQFPNPFEHEMGLQTPRGVASYRALQACYQAWRAATLVRGRSSPKILEIGAGLGRTAYYANQAGLKDYTIIDIPTSNAAQAYFLGRVLSPELLVLSGERNKKGAEIRIMNTQWRPKSGERFDLAINVDSLTEMDRDTALEYLDMIRKHCDVFVSINHEVNAFTARELFSKIGMAEVRSKYWLRPGYVEEIVRISN